MTRVQPWSWTWLRTACATVTRLGAPEAGPVRPKAATRARTTRTPAGDDTRFIDGSRTNGFGHADRPPSRRLHGECRSRYSGIPGVSAPAPARGAVAQCNAMISRTFRFEPGGPRQGLDRPQGSAAISQNF